MTGPRPPERTDGITTRQLGGYLVIAAAILAVVRLVRRRTPRSS